MAKLFLSYSRKDSKSAQDLIEALKKMEHDVWVDWESILPASDWLAQIFHGIEGAEAFIFLVSPDSIKSEVCSVELGHAVANNKRIVPVVIRDVKPEDTNEEIRKRNWVFLRKDDDYETGLTNIKDAIELDFEWVEEHSRLQSWALEWDRMKESALLLRGGELRRVRAIVAGAAKKEPLPTDLQNLYIKHSLAAERRRLTLITLTTITLLLMTGLFFFALFQRNLAQENEQIAQMNEETANEQRELAEINEQTALKNEQEANDQRAIAEEQRAFAESQKLIAQAQRSAARAQIYQIQPDELYTSTLFAVASWKTYPTIEADEILRKNISLLPIPVKQMNHEGGINSLEFNTARDLFITGGGDGKACVWRASDGEMIFCSTSPKSVNDAVFSPDGKYVVTGDSSGEVQIIRTVDWSVVNTFNADTIVWDLDIGNDGQDIAVTRDDGRISIVDIETGEKNYDLFVTGNIRIASFSPNGNYIAAGANTGVVTLWNLDAGGNPITSGRHRGEVLALTFSPDSRYLITGGEDGYAAAARTIDGQEIYKRLHEDAVTDIAFNPKDGSWFATVSNDRRVRLWNTENGTERIRMSQDSFVDAVDVSANGQWLATTGADNTVRVWNASTGTQMFQIPIMDSGAALGFGNDGNVLIAGDQAGDINVWDISEMPSPDNYLQFDVQVGDLEFSSSGEWVAISSGTRVWVLRPEELSTLTEVPSASLNIVAIGNITNLRFSPDSYWLGFSTDQGYVYVYNLLSNVQQTLVSSGDEHKIAFSPDSMQLFVLQSEGSIDAWNLRTREQTVAFAGGSAQVISMAVGSTQIALGIENEIQILNEDGERIYSIDSPGDHTHLVFNEGESLLASSNSAGFIEVWQLGDDAASLVGSIQKETVHSMSFDPAGTELAIGTTNNVYLIDAATVQEAARIPHSGLITGISYSIDGNVMATSSLKAAQFWDMTSIQSMTAEDLVDAACARMAENFSEAQWSNLFGGEEYRVLCEGLPTP